ncbi:MAG: class I SAM-dependent methyltransferase, partial [Acidobacteriaceae bacterium]
MMNLMHHDAEILDQFTRQAEPFLRRHENSHQGLLQLMVDCADVRRQDTVLDIACGPGIVSCFFAQHAARVTGLDIVPAMLERAGQLQAARKLTNIDWALGESTA